MQTDLYFTCWTMPGTSQVSTQYWLIDVLFIEQPVIRIIYPPAEKTKNGKSIKLRRVASSFVQIIAMSNVIIGFFLPSINGNITAKKCEFSMCVFRSTFAYSKFGIIYALHQYCYCNSHSPFLVC